MLRCISEKRITWVFLSINNDSGSQSKGQVEQIMPLLETMFVVKKASLMGQKN
jgi:hypothetical protein